MGSVIANPDTTVANNGAITPSGTAHGVLADSSDSTYVTLNQGETVWCGFADPVIPTGARVTGTLLAVRWAAIGYGTLAESTLTVGDGSSGTQTNLIQTGPVSQAIPAGVSGSRDTTTAGFVIKNIYVGDLRLYKVWISVGYVAKPSVNITAPTGTVTTSTPTVSWVSTLDSGGGPQTGWSAEIYKASDVTASTRPNPALAVVTGGSQGGSHADVGASSWTVPEALANDDYYAFVQVSQTVDGTPFYSDWDPQAFTVNTPVPGIDTFTVTPSNANGRISMTLTAKSGGSWSSTSWYEVEVRYSTDDDWVALRSPHGAGIVTVASTGYDREAPNNVTAYYRARAVHDNGDGTTVVGAWVTGSGKWSSDQEYLRHPTDPSLDVAIELRSFAGHSRAARQTVEQPLGRTDVVVVSDTRSSETGTMVIACADDATRDAVMALAADGAPILFNPGQSDHERTRWMALGDETVERLIDGSRFTERNVSYEWQEVARPEGNPSAWI